MTPSLVQQTSVFTSGSETSQALAYGSNLTANNLLISAAGWNNTSTSGLALADTQTNTWTQGAVDTTSISGYSTAWWYAKAASSAADTATLTLPGSGAGFVRLWLFEFSGVDTFDVAINGHSSVAGTTATSNAFTTTHATELAFCLPLFDNGTPSPGTGWTASSPLVQSELCEWQVYTSVQTGVTATATTSASGNWSFIGGTFYSTGGTVNTSSQTATATFAGAVPKQTNKLVSA